MAARLVNAWRAPTPLTGAALLAALTLSGAAHAQKKPRPPAATSAAPAEGDAAATEAADADAADADEAATDAAGADEAPAASAGAALSTDGSEVELAEDSGDGSRPPPLFVRMGGRLYSKSFRYTGTLAESLTGFPELTTYNLASAPMISLRGEWYPAAHFRGDWLANIGLIAGFEAGIATSVQYDEQTLDQTHNLWFIGPHARLPLGDHWLGAFITYGSHKFEISGDDTVSSPSLGGAQTRTSVFPDLLYSYVDIGVDARLRFEYLRMGGHLQHRQVLGVGEIGDAEWYPSASARGLSFGGEVGWKLAEWLDAVVSIDVLQYGFDFNPVEDDRPVDRVAGGATDCYLSVLAALEGVWPGQTAVPPAKPGAPPREVPTEEEDSFDSFDDDFLSGETPVEGARLERRVTSLGVSPCMIA